MNDTASEIGERFRAMLLARIGEERLIMGVPCGIPRE